MDLRSHTRGLQLAVFAGHRNSVICLAVFGDTLFTGSPDTTARAWSVATGVQVRLGFE